MSFGNNLRVLIKERNLTQKEVAKQINMAPSTLGSYVQGTREPDFATLKTIADYFDVSIDYLLDHDIHKYSSPLDKEMFHVFSSLDENEKCICIELCKVFVKMHFTNKNPR
ncbi:helix-turn-helix domain-containing protein [Gallibacter intestinalis]|uniref:Helix-turn-helix transcriptional regulator n=1 Tax=Gallibacter intestinalis TaxID=2779356 RepID=A0ABR9QX60_9FIRM|nr:helix-turn-helix transcriptional regulator [Gallibacter intestinalis]MBE5035466.1 helix-turn-helix transcriptional regulator [Gallibacter intestinalis]